MRVKSRKAAAGMLEQCCRISVARELVDQRKRQHVRQMAHQRKHAVVVGGAHRDHAHAGELPRRGHHPDGAGIGLGLGRHDQLVAIEQARQTRRARRFSRCRRSGAPAQTAQTPHRDNCERSRSHRVWCCRHRLRSCAARGAGAICASTAAVWPSGTASSTKSASFTATAGSVAISSMMPSRRAASRLARLRPTPTTCATALRFLSASANEPPIKPTPKMTSLPSCGGRYAQHRAASRWRLFMRREIAAALRGNARFPIRGRC